MFACIRPESATIRTGDAPETNGHGGNVLKGLVEVSSFLGTQIRYQIKVESGPQIDVAVSKVGNAVHPSRTGVYASVPAEDVMLLSD